MTPNTLPQLLIDARDAARLLSISPRTLWSLTKAGKIPVVRIGRRVLYATDTLRAWITERERH